MTTGGRWSTYSPTCSATTCQRVKAAGLAALGADANSTAVKHQHEYRPAIDDLLQTETPEEQARSMKCQIAVAMRPLAGDINGFGFVFAGTPCSLFGSSGALIALYSRSIRAAISLSPKEGRFESRRHAPYKFIGTLPRS